MVAAAAVFTRSGVDAPSREIAAEAKVGQGTLYRHFPTRTDLIAAVFRGEVDTCAAAAADIAQYFPDDHVAALRAWLHRYVEFLLAKRGLGGSLRTGELFTDLYKYFDDQLEPALTGLMAAGVSSGQLRNVLAPRSLLHAVRGFCIPGDEDIDKIKLIVDVLMDGLATPKATH